MVFVLFPIYLIIKEYNSLYIVIGIMVTTSFILKQTWYNKLNSKSKNINIIKAITNNETKTTLARETTKVS